MVVIPHGSSVQLHVSGLNPNVTFLVIQAHTLYTPLRLQTIFPMSTDTIRGSSVGMVATLKNGMTSAIWNISVADDSVKFNVSAMVMMQAYGNNAPVPGGCNQVFQLETDPNILLAPSGYDTDVWFQWASPPRTTGSPLVCDRSDRNFGDLTYDLYVGYVSGGSIGEEGLFDLLANLWSVETIEENAQKFISLQNDGVKKSRVLVTSQQSRGSVYLVIVRDNTHGTAASYVSSVTYACNFTAGECDLNLGALDITFMLVCGVLGVFLVFFGHQFLKTELAMFGFISVTLVAFLLLSLTNSMSETACLGIAAGLGIIGALLSVFVWWWLAFPSISVLLPGLTAGYIIACILFFTPFANISWWNASLNYGLVFACVALLYLVVLLCSPLTLNIVSCSLVGGFGIVMVAAIPLHSSLKLLFLNSVRHATVTEYTQVIIVSPFQTVDIVLTGVWAALLILGAAFQFYRQHGKPRFPTATRRRGIWQRRRRGQDSERPSTPMPDETAPLLGNQAHAPPPPYNASIQRPQRHDQLMPPR